jgi:hypothetical protein
MKTLKISTEERIEAYKYYTPGLTRKAIKLLLNTGHIESTVISVLWIRKNRFNEAEMIFKRHTKRVSHDELAKEFNCSRRRINNALNDVRRALIDEINKEVNAGLLTYIEIPEAKKLRKTSIRKQTINTWNKHKETLK